MLNRLYLWLGMLVPASYALYALMGWELFDAPRDKVDPNTPHHAMHHNSHGPAFWFFGVHGGK